MVKGSLWNEGMIKRVDGSKGIGKGSLGIEGMINGALGM